MSYESRLRKAFENALRLPLNQCTKYVIFSDCHRGIGNTNDHPYSITCLEIEGMHISLVKWALSAGDDMRLYVSREVLSGPFSLV